MNIGEKIKQLRIKNGLTQEELASRCELSKGFISQLERDLTSPSIATLMDILESLGTNIKDFFNETINEKVVFKKEDVFEKEDKELAPDGCSEMDDPHDGEEFGYVLAGSINVLLGAQKFKVKKGESFYFKPSVTHKISNASKSEAVVLWISSPPSF